MEKTKTKILKKNQTPEKENKAILKKGSKEELESANKAAVTQKVIVNRVLKYKYPKGCTDTLSRKTFRQKTRNALRKMERELSKLHGEEKQTAKAKLDAFVSERLS